MESKFRAPAPIISKHQPRHPDDKLIVVTGLSGLRQIFARFRRTLYAEGQRRYVNPLSAYAADQFLSLMEKPDVDHWGLSPAISIEQNRRPITRDPR